jgi:hypothetical protein
MNKNTGLSEAPMNSIKKTTLLLLFLCLSNHAAAQLTVRTSAYGSKPGYIDEARLVVEPHGAYVEQSIYLSYADHKQYAGSISVEIDHRFTLPANAVVTDLWLWIGDYIVQGRILSTWQARSIYDSIVSSHRDPAFLSKTGNSYELHVYPLVSGSIRKIMLRFITPTRWLRTNAAAELPLRMLKDNNAQIKPVQVVFKMAENIWGTPAIQEVVQSEFGVLNDSAGYKFRTANVEDISALSSFTLGFNTQFNDGYFFTSTDALNDGSYFQFGFNPGRLFGLQIDSTSKHLLFALDLSGAHNKNYATLIPNFKQLMASVAKPNDSIMTIVAGAGRIEALDPQWKPGSIDTINAVMDRFVRGDWGGQIADEKYPHILYADGNAATCWQFPGLDNYATYNNYGNIISALRDFKEADIIAAYAHGHEDANNTKAYLPLILAKTDSFFVQGGRLLSYYDFNRVNKELIGSHYIAGLSITKTSEAMTTLYRNVDGNIGMYFPETIVHNVFNYLTYTPDPNVKIEMQDQAGRPYIISKKIGNGLLVVSSIWSFKDEGALRALLGVPLLGLNVVTKRNQMLTGLLENVKQTYDQCAFDRAIVLSNSDSLFQKADAKAWTNSYYNGYSGRRPEFTTINLLDGAGYIPVYLIDDLVTYYGSGYLMKTVADAFGGRHFETSMDEWKYINSALSAFSYPVADSLTVTASVDAGAGQLKEMREVNPLPGDGDKPRFYIGQTSHADSITFNIHSTFSGIPGEQIASKTVSLNHDTTKMDRIIPAMLGNERLRDLFAAPVRDTAAIVNLAMKYRLLCDYTAFLVLDGDTIHSTKDPPDDPRVDAPALKQAGTAGSFTLTAYPSPFSGRTNIVVSAVKPSIVRVAVYNILGQLVRVLAFDESILGTKIYIWDGTDSDNMPVSNGMYFITLTAREAAGGSTKTILRTVIFTK